MLFSYVMEILGLAPRGIHARKYKHKSLHVYQGQTTAKHFASLDVAGPSHWPFYERHRRNRPVLIAGRTLLWCAQ